MKDDSRIDTINDDKETTDYLFDNLKVPQLIMKASNLASNFKIPIIKKPLQKNSQLIREPIIAPKPFESLQLKELDPYDIPNEISSIELENNSSNFWNLVDMIEDSRKIESVYIELATSMVHLEDCAQLASVHIFDAYEINLHLISQENNVFELKLNVSILFFPNSIQVHL